MSKMSLEVHTYWMLMKLIILLVKNKQRLETGKTDVG